MTGAVTLRFSTQAQLDIRRITQDLGDLQRQIATGAKAYDLVGFGAGAGRLINASGLRAATEARASNVSQLEARLVVQGSALGRVASAADNLAVTIREAIAADDGRGVDDALPLVFATIVDALNEEWNGQPLFAGERTTEGPVQVTTLEQLRSVAPSAWFDEAARPQVIDLGGAEPVRIADKASEIATDLFHAIRTLSDMVESAGGNLGSPMGVVTRDQLIALAEDLDASARQVNNAEGRVGQLQKRFEEERVRLQAQSDLLTKTIGDQADADLAEVSMKLSALMAQYEAAAKTFVDLSQLTLLRYL